MSELKLENLLSRLRNHDKSALREVFEAHHSMVCTVIHRYIRDRALTEDLAQQVFIRIWEKRETINISSNLPAYLRRMGVNEALMHLRKNNIFDSDTELTPNLAKETTNSGEDTYLAGELSDHIAQAIDALPPRCSAIFKLSRYEELTYKEIAERLDISSKTVENQMGKALKLLRESLKQYL